jgi:PIN domain nuclease of toxin-antitoxin system
VARLRLLLDTHIWLWSFIESSRLARRVRAELDNLENELWLSPISLWEALALQRKNRINVPSQFDQWWVQALNQFREAPLTYEVVFVANQLRLHGDPADRFLAATAKVYGLTLVTADERLLGLGDIATLANR